MINIDQCRVGGARRVGDWLYVPNGTDLLRFRVLPTPLGIARDYHAVLALRPWRCRPRLLFVRNAAGSGGLFLGDYIVLGRDDIEGIAQQVWQSYIDHPSPQHLQVEDLFWDRRRRFVSSEAVYAAVVRYLLAHEVGHEAVATHEPAPQVIDELRSDINVGLTAGALGWDVELLRMVAHAIGCRRHPDDCDHPAPEERVAAVDRGVEMFEAECARVRAPDMPDVRTC